MNVFDMLNSGSQDNGAADVALKDCDGYDSSQSDPNAYICAMTPLDEEVDFYLEKTDGEGSVRPA